MHIIILYLKMVGLEQKRAEQLECKPDFSDTLPDKDQVLNTCWEMRTYLEISHLRGITCIAKPLNC